MDLTVSIGQTKSRSIAISRNSAYCALLFIFLAITIAESSYLKGIISHANIARFSIVICMLIADIVFSDRRLESRVIAGVAVPIALILLAIASLCMLQKQYGIVWLIAIAYCSRSIDAVLVIRTLLFSSALSIVLIVSLCALRLIPDAVIEGRGLYGRHSLGFLYPTFLSHYYLGLVCAVIYLCRRNVKYFVLVLLLVIDVLIYVFTDSRNSSLLVLFVLFYGLIIRTIQTKRSKKASVITFFLSFSFVICALVSTIVFVAVDYSSGFGVQLNAVLSNRISLTQTALESYPLGVLGNEVQWSTWQTLDDGSTAIGYFDEDRFFVPAPYLYVDNSYINVMITAGVPIFLVVILLVTVFTIKAARANDATLVFLMAVFAVHSIVDPQLLELSVCPFLALLLCRTDALRKAAESLNPGCWGNIDVYRSTIKRLLYPISR